MSQHRPRLVGTAFRLKQVSLQAQIDQVAAKLWGIIDDEPKPIHAALREIQRP